MTEFLTLAITETSPNTGAFNVVAMETTSQVVVALSLVREQIVSLEGHVFWDIGFVTTVSGNTQRKYSANSNSPFLVTGSTKLGANKIAEVKAICDAKSTTPQIFFNNEKHRYGILKVSKVENLSIAGDQQSEVSNLRHYLSVRVHGVPHHQNSFFLLNKDYRWINFWNWACRNGLWDEKKSKYLTLLNSGDKELYLILYRHHFQSGSHDWIVGMHWL